jgi:hypothetical protein
VAEHAAVAERAARIAQAELAAARAAKATHQAAADAREAAAAAAALRAEADAGEQEDYSASVDRAGRTCGFDGGRVRNFDAEQMWDKRARGFDSGRGHGFDIERAGGLEGGHAGGLDADVPADAGAWAAWELWTQAGEPTQMLAHRPDRIRESTMHWRPSGTRSARRTSGPSVTSSWTLADVASTHVASADKTLARGALAGGAPALPRTGVVVDPALLPSFRPLSRILAPAADVPCSPGPTTPSGQW